MVKSMKECGLMTIPQDLAESYIQMVNHTLDTSSREKEKVRVSSEITMALYMKDSGRQTKEMAKAKRHCQMVTPMKETSRMTE